MHNDAISYFKTYRSYTQNARLHVKCVYVNMKRPSFRSATHVAFVTRVSPLDCLGFRATIISMFFRQPSLIAVAYARHDDDDDNADGWPTIATTDRTFAVCNGYAVRCGRGVSPCVVYLTVQAGNSLGCDVCCGWSRYMPTSGFRFRYNGRGKRSRHKITPHNEIIPTIKNNKIIPKCFTFTF